MVLGQWRDRSEHGTAGLQGKVEGLLVERQKLLEAIKRKEGMVDNTEREQGGWSKSERVYKAYQSEIFRWNQEVGEMRARLSGLDKETDEYERTIKAIEGGIVRGVFSLSVVDWIEQVRRGKEMVREAEEELIRIYDERKEERARERE